MTTNLEPERKVGEKKFYSRMYTPQLVQSVKGVGKGYQNMNNMYVTKLKAILQKYEQ